MKIRQYWFVLTFAAFLIVGPAGGHRNPLAQNQQSSPQVFELNTVLMQSTFAIQIPDAQQTLTTIGTVFVMGRPFPKSDPNQPDKARYVLITAAHVLSDISSDFAILQFRRKLDNGDWSAAPSPVRIRANGQPLWTRHATADVAVMYISVPSGVSIPLLSTEMLADDALLEKWDIHPGDSLECLGYPMGMSGNAAGFSILRSGKIASFPLLPTDKTKTFLLDFRVFKGNSGGPVYLVESTRTVRSATMLGTVGFIMGVVTDEASYTEQFVGKYSAEVHQYQLGLAVVVHASLIKQAINMLPSPETIPD
jgi:hypothetical protein